VGTLQTNPDEFFGHILRSMGYINEHWASADMAVNEIIVALEDDQQLR
jgi:hypothetical protein